MIKRLSAASVRVDLRCGAPFAYDLFWHVTGLWGCAATGKGGVTIKGLVAVVPEPHTACWVPCTSWVLQELAL